MSTSKANERQVGGDHYRKVEGEQHWDRQWRLYGRGYFIGCITKYVERYPDKNGVQDLEKAIHFIQKLIELEKASTPAKPNPMKRYMDGVSRFKCVLCGTTVTAIDACEAWAVHGQCKPKAE